MQKHKTDWSDFIPGLLATGLLVISDSSGNLFGYVAQIANGEISQVSTDQ
jgi:hypothetical protein